MKKYKERIKAMFEANKHLNKLVITSDGYGFTEGSKAHAEAHQATLTSGEIAEVTRADYFPEENPPTEDRGLLDGNLKSVKKQVAALDSMETLEELKAEELSKGDEARKGAVEAIESRIEELTKAIVVDAEVIEPTEENPTA